MDTAPQYRRFLVRLTGSFSVICALAAGINYFIDPYGLFGTVRVDGLNARKPASGERVRTSKPYMASAYRPKTVIAGNSRPELGLDPQSPCWPEEDKPVFNSGIPGASFYMQTQYAKHALSADSGRKVLLGVDFLDFLTDTTALPTTSPPDWANLSKNYAGRLDIPGENASTWRMIGTQAQDKLSALFSLSSLVDSFLTVAQQRMPFATDRRADGFNPGHDYEAIIRNEGQHVLFQQKNTELAARLSKPGFGLFIAGQEHSTDFEALKNFLAWAQREEIEVVLFINPYHLAYLQAIDTAGLWPAFDDWKRHLTRIAGESDVPLWDFNSIDAYSTEAPPGRGKRGTSIHWYWEPAHYKREMGELMLAKLLARSCAEGASSSTPGRLLSIDILEAYLAEMRTKLANSYISNASTLH
jgi:hypothetical protein